MVGASVVGGRYQLLIWTTTRVMDRLLDVDAAYRRLGDVAARSAVIGDVGECGVLGPLFIGCKTSTNTEEFVQKP